MSQTGKEYVMEKARELMDAHTCCAEAREAAQAWLDAIGTDKEAEMLSLIHISEPTRPY